jgi:hypothetical protein
MKKRKLFDFTVATAIIVLAGYAVVFTVSLFMLVHNEGDRTAGIVFNAVLFATLLAVIVYYLLLAPFADENGIRHLGRFIPRARIVWETQYNRRLRYAEILIRDSSIRYDRLSSREIRHVQIKIQHTAGTERFLEKYAPGKAGKGDAGHEA